jgi:hypothetical protein
LSLKSHARNVGEDMLRAATLTILLVLLSLPSAFANTVLFNGSGYDFAMGGLVQPASANGIHIGAANFSVEDMAADMGGGGRSVETYVIPMELTGGSEEAADPEPPPAPVFATTILWAYNLPLPHPASSPALTETFGTESVRISDLAYVVPALPQSILWQVPAQAVVELPEPGSLALLGVGLAVLAARWRTRRQ